MVDDQAYVENLHLKASLSKLQNWHYTILLINPTDGFFALSANEINFSITDWQKATKCHLATNDEDNFSIGAGVRTVCVCVCVFVGVCTFVLVWVCLL